MTPKPSIIQQHLGAGRAITQDGEIITVNTPGASLYLNDGKGYGFAPPKGAAAPVWHAQRRPKKAQPIMIPTQKPLYTKLYALLSGVSIHFVYEWKDQTLTFLSQGDGTISVEEPYYKDEGVYIVAWSPFTPNIDDGSTQRELLMRNVNIWIYDEQFGAFNIQSQPVVDFNDDEFVSDNKFCHRAFECVTLPDEEGDLEVYDYSVIRADPSAFDARVKNAIQAAIALESWHGFDTSNEVYYDHDDLDNIFREAGGEATYRFWDTTEARTILGLGFLYNQSDGLLLTDGPTWTIFRVRADFQDAHGQVLADL